MACSNHGSQWVNPAAKEGDGMPAKAAAARPRRERTENAAKRRRQLIEATIDSIVAHALSAPTLATVSHGAGLPPGLPVFSFRNKHTLLAATLKSHNDEYHRAWQSAIHAARDDTAEKITQLND